MTDNLVTKLLQKSAIYNFYQRIIRGNRIEEILSKEINQNDTSYTLDLACGPGLYSYLFRPRYYVGVDITERYILFAKKSNPGKVFMIMDVRCLGFKENSFNNIIAFGLLHHLPDHDIHQTLREVKSISKENGQILIFDLVPPSSNYNIVGKALVKLDRGKYARNINDYGNLLSSYFKILKQYSIKKWPYEFCVFVLKNC